MPNHVTNILTLSGSVKDKNKVLAFIKGDNGAIDFNKIVPSEKEDDWYQFHIDNWGTKWNAYNITDNDDELIFDTAWSTPLEAMNKLSKLFPYVEITVEYADGDMGHNLGRYSLSNGVLKEDWNPASSTPEAYEHYVKVKDIGKEEFAEYGLNDKFEFVGYDEDEDER